MTEKGYTPPYTITDDILTLVANITELVTTISISKNLNHNPRLRRDNRIKTIHASLAIENNSLSLEQITDIINGKRILGAEREICEVKNAFDTYEQISHMSPYSIDDMLHAHKLLMQGLAHDAGCFRNKGVGVFAEKQLVHMAPPATHVPQLVSDLVNWAKHSNTNQLIKSCIFHYELEFIHPFSDGNGRMGRLWQTLLLREWNELFTWLPVETLIRNSQSKYYSVLGECDKAGNSTNFIEFMLTLIHQALLDVQQSDQVTAQVTDQVKKLLNLMKYGEYSAMELMQLVNISHKQTFRKNYLNPCLELGYIEMTMPDTPTHRNQRYIKVKDIT